MCACHPTTSIHHKQINSRSDASKLFPHILNNILRNCPSSHPHPVTMKQISEQTTSDILTLLSQGLSTREIARRAGVSKSTVSNIRTAHLPGESTSKGGRPNRLSTREKRLIVRKITSGEYDTAVDVKRMLANNHGVEVHANTAQNALKEAGMKGAVKRKKARILPRHVQARLEFARKYQDWTVEDWKRVIWSDETKIN